MLFVLMHALASAQVATWNWARTLDAGSDEYVRDIAVEPLTGNHPEKLSDLIALALLTEKELDNTVVRESAVYFASGKADIAPAFEPQLAKLVSLMQRHPNMDLVIEAHTDAEGSNATNLKLSQLRAQRIMDHLTRNGIAGDRLVPVGHGENHPIADNATEEGRGMNRRVEFRIQVPKEEQAYEKRR